jgi:hypothetical protein
MRLDGDPVFVFDLTSVSHLDAVCHDKGYLVRPACRSLAVGSPLILKYPRLRVHHALGLWRPVLPQLFGYTMFENFCQGLGVEYGGP